MNNQTKKGILSAKVLSEISEDLERARVRNEESYINIQEAYMKFRELKRTLIQEGVCDEQ